jgi:DNA-binding transcriptional LysR family regulator
VSSDFSALTWTLTHSLFLRFGLLPNVTLEVKSIETARRMIKNKLGIGFLPQIAVTTELGNGQPVRIYLSHTEPLRPTLDVVYPLLRSLDKNARAFFLALKKVCVSQ